MQTVAAVTCCNFTVVLATSEEHLYVNTFLEGMHPTSYTTRDYFLRACLLVCLFVCMYVCLYVCMYVYMYVYVCFLCVCLFVFVYVCVCLCVCLFVCVCLYVCLFVNFIWTCSKHVTALILVFAV